jgi:hypothetical protein
MKILYNYHGKYELFKVHRKQDDGYLFMNEASGFWLGLDKYVISIHQDDETLEQIKEKYPERFL